MVTKEELYKRLQEVRDLLDDAEYLAETLSDMYPRSGEQMGYSSLRRYFTERWEFERVEVDRSSTEFIEDDYFEGYKVKVLLGMGNVHTWVWVAINEEPEGWDDPLIHFLGAGDFDAEAIGPTLYFRGENVKALIKELEKYEKELAEKIAELDAKEEREVGSHEE